MEHRLFIPHPALADFVSGILVFRADLRCTPNEIINPFPPTPEQYLYFYLADPVAARKQDESFFSEKPGTMIVGAQLSRVDLNMGKNHSMLAVIFRPGGLYRLLGGLPMMELTDADHDSSLLLGSGMTRIREQLQHASSWDQSKAIVESWLLSRLSKVKTLSPFDHAMRAAMQSGGLLPVEQLASIACTSIRQFERQCLTRIGMGPKILSRITRFSAAYRLYERHPDMTWISIAHSTGYFDQMHMVRDFKQFAGMVPTLLQSSLLNTPLRLQAGIRE